MNIIYIKKKKPSECPKYCIICGPDVCSENIDWDWIESEAEGKIPSAESFGKAVKSVAEDLDRLLEE